MKASAVLVVAVSLMAGPARPHHSFAAEYYADRAVELTGTVTLLEWTNPHARLYLDVTDEAGNTVNWDLELGPPNGLMRRGWRRDSLQPGQMVSVSGFLSRLAPNAANARTVKLSDGREVFAGSSFDTSEGAN
jgi:hypothetical protein